MPSLPQTDTKGVAATLDEIKAAWEQNLEAPIACDDGSVFQFALRDERIMGKTVAGLTANPLLTVEWRRLDNTTVTVNAAALSAYYNECQEKQIQRGFTVDAEYLYYKQNGATLRDLENWKAIYKDGYIPPIPST